MGRESRLMREKQELVTKAVVNGLFNYDQLVKMLTDRARYMNTYELDQMLAAVDLSEDDLDV